MKFYESNYLTFPFKVGMLVRDKSYDIIGTIVEFYPFSIWCIIVQYKNKQEGAYCQEELEIVK